MKNKKIYILLVIFGVSFNYAQDEIINIPDVVTKVATASGAWLRLETGTKAIGMGGAAVASGNGIYAAPYNPAAIGFIDNSEVFFSRTNYIDGDGHSVTGYARRLSSTDHIGLHLYHFSTDDMIRRTVEVSDGSLGTFKFQGICIRGMYTRTLTDRLKVGVSLKYIREMNWEAYWHTFAFDIGSNFDTGIYGLFLGMSVSNFGPDVQYRGDAGSYSDANSTTGEYSYVMGEFPLPLTFRLGLMKHVIGNDESASIIIPGHRLTVAVDGINPIDYTVTSGLGLEYSWNEQAFARIGTHLGHSTKGLSIGAGVKFSRISVDYAYLDYGDLEATHQFGISLDFGDSNR